MSSSTLYYIIYHRNCPDGMMASWIYLQYCKLYKSDLKNIVLVPADAGNVPTNLSWDKAHIIMLDISFGKDDLLAIASKASSVLILDHHKTAQTNLSGTFPENVRLVFNMEKCGAQLTWDECFPYLDYPWYVEVVADRDLWRWTFPNSKPLGKYLMDNGYFESHDQLDKVSNWSTAEMTQAIAVGKVMLEVDDHNIDMYVKSAILCEFKAPDKTYRVYLVGCPHKYASDVGHKLSSSSECDFAVMWRYSFEEDVWNLSCRSSKNRPDIDLSVICSQFGSGGGHKHAAGFKINNHSFGLRSYFSKINAANIS